MKTQTATKLTTIEQRASEYVAMRIRLEQPIDFTLVYKQSAQYGWCPTVYDYRDEKIAYAGGYGYDKESTAISQIVRFIFPEGSEQYKEIAMLAGVGADSVSGKLKEYGWQMSRVGRSPITTSYRVEKIT